MRKEILETKIVTINGHKFGVGDRVVMMCQGRKVKGTVRCVHPDWPTASLCVERDDRMGGGGCNSLWHVGRLTYNICPSKKEEQKNTTIRVDLGRLTIRVWCGKCGAELPNPVLEEDPPWGADRFFRLFVAPCPTCQKSDTPPVSQEGRKEES